MKPNIVLISEDKLIQDIFHIRKEIVEKGLATPDPRSRALPHSTILYTEEDLGQEKINQIIQKLDRLKINNRISLKIKEYVYWEPKIAAMLDISPLQSLKIELDCLLGNLNFCFNKEYISLYGNTIGDHVKLARGIYPDKADDSIRLFRANLPKQITFSRIAFIGYNTEEKDILWQRNLS